MIDVHPQPLEIGASTELQQVVTHLGGDTVYYKASRDVSSTSSDGTLTAGQTLKLTSTKWFATAVARPSDGKPGAANVNVIPKSPSVNRLTPVAGVPSDSSFDYVPVNGEQAVDSTTNIEYVRINGSWVATSANGPQGPAGTGFPGLDLWADQATPSAITDWGTVAQTYLNNGSRRLLFQPGRTFPFTTKPLLSGMKGVIFEGSGGAGWSYVSGMWGTAASKLLWKNGASSGNFLDGGAGSEGITLRDLGIFYDHAAYDGDLIAAENAQWLIERCSIGSLNGTQMTARSLIKLYQAVLTTVRNCGLSGGIDLIRGHEAGGTGVSDDCDVIGNSFSNASHAFICNPGREMTIDRNNMEFGFGSSATPYGVTSDLAGGAEAKVAFAFTNNRLWDMTNNTQVGLYEPPACAWNVLIEHNLFDMKAAIKLNGAGDSPTPVATIRHNHWTRTFVAGDPSPIDVGTNARICKIEKNRCIINAGGPPLVANKSAQKYLAIEGDFETGWGYKRSAPLSTNPTIALHGTPANVTGVSIFGTDEAGIIEIGVGGAGASATGMLADITFTTAQLPVPGGGGNTVVVISPYEIQGYTNGVLGAAAANAYASTSGNAGFSIGVQTGLPLSGRYHFAYRVIQT
jgi:hypothetical protein